MPVEYPEANGASARPTATTPSSSEVVRLMGHPSFNSLFIGPPSPGEPHYAAPPVVHAVAGDEVGRPAPVRPGDSRAFACAVGRLDPGGAYRRRCAGGARRRGRCDTGRLL